MNITKTILYYVLFSTLFIVCYGVCVERAMASISGEPVGSSGFRVTKVRF